VWNVAGAEGSFSSDSADSQNTRRTPRRTLLKVRRGVCVCWRTREDHSAHSQDTTAARYPTTVEHRPPSCSEHGPPLCSATSTHQPDEASGVDPSAITLKQLKARRPGPTFEPNAAVLVHGKAGTVLKVTHLDETRASTSPRAPPPPRRLPRVPPSCPSCLLRQRRRADASAETPRASAETPRASGSARHLARSAASNRSEERRPTPAGRVVNPPSQAVANGPVPRATYDVQYVDGKIVYGVPPEVIEAE
jgi:hypothetical protein